MKKCLSALLTLAVISLCVSPLVAEDWKPVEGQLMTRWAKDLDPEKPWPAYPRPKMVRGDWANLNGLWDYAIQPKDNKQPEAWAGKILVPFCVESALSGVKKRLGKDNRLWYRRDLKVAGDLKGKRVLLHFGAVDWDCTVTVNGKEVGSHKGGYDPFCFDITDALKKDGNELIVSVWDPTSDGHQARGKQVNRPAHIWYTPVSGIWQTVWLETVAKTHIESLKIVPDVDGGKLKVIVNVAGADSADVWAVARDGSKKIAEVKGSSGDTLELAIENAKLWSPDSPFLYDLDVGIKGGDEVKSYFGMRKVSMAKDDKGVLRMLLNDKFVFHYGPLDQGWWPDGLYTPATEEGLVYDLEVIKDLGMNMLRKHFKVEPERLYYHCDKMGLLVWQDMPGGNFGKSAEGKKQYRVEHKRLIEFLHNYPCIVMWVPFNEGWGQHDTVEVAKWVKELDPTRLVNEASGWHDKKSGDIRDKHSYPGPAMPGLEEKRVAVLGEFGGLGLPVPGHLWWNKRNWGYRNYKSKGELQHHYDTLIHKMKPMVERGLCGAVYTQTSDVEGEVNGLMTYDREVLKIDPKHSAALHACLYDLSKELPAITELPPPPIVKIIVPTSEAKGQEWRYTTEKPSGDWIKDEFDDSAWKTGKGMFGTAGTPGVRVGTEWKTPDIYIRRTFELKELPKEPYLRVYHDDAGEVYINGKLAKSLPGYTSELINVPMGKAAALLRVGKNTIAVHCHQDAEGQGVDAGIAELKK